MRSNFKKVFNKIEQKFERVKRTAPKILANEGVKVFMSNFKTESFEGEKWEEPKRKIEGTYEYKYPKKRDLGRRSRPILIGKTRTLKNATNTSIKEANVNRIRWSNWTKYAKRHNEGLDGMPMRKFMGTGRLFKRRIKMKFNELYRTGLK